MSYPDLDLTELPPLLNTLTTLNCSNNRLIRLPKHLPNTLTYLYCSNNRLTRLPEHLPNSLQVLYCYNNRLTRLPKHLPNTLTRLYCFNNRLTKFPEQLPNSLTHLYCGNNPFLFNRKTNLKILRANPQGVFQTFPKWNNKNTTSFCNYKVLSVIHRKTQKKCKRSKPTYFNRDLTRLCNMY